MTENEFEFLLAINQTDWNTRVIYADWLEEQGEHVRANGQRWQAKNKKHPRKWDKHNDTTLQAIKNLWFWFDDQIDDWANCLPQHIFIEIGFQFPHSGYKDFRFYRTCKNAEIDLALGLQKKNIIA
jgi:uncharacterized protein (TIGR02996 family)